MPLNIGTKHIKKCQQQRQQKKEQTIFDKSSGGVDK